MPRMSEKVLSYTINSFLLPGKPPTLGIMMALLIMEIGMAYTNDTNGSLSMKKLMTIATTNVDRSKATKATRNDFQMMGHFSLVSSNSSAASSTIIISPTMPNTSSVGNQSRSLTPIDSRIKRMTMPVTMSINTEGTLVLRATML